MDRTDLDQISRALRLLISAQPPADVVERRNTDEQLEARALLRAVLDRNGRTIKDTAADAALETRRARMVHQLERGLAAGVAA